MLNCPVEQQYEVPVGYYDQPYMYVDEHFFADTVNPVVAVNPWNGLDKHNFMLATDGDSDFIVRRVFPCSPAMRVQYYDDIGQPWFTAPFNSRALHPYPYSWPVVPEKIYKPGAFIQYDLLSLDGGVNQVFNWTAMLNTRRYYTIWQGVRRFRGNARYPAESDYVYHDRRFSYVSTFALNWVEMTTDNIAAPTVFQQNPFRRYTVKVDDYDFVLEDIKIGSAPDNRVMPVFAAMTTQQFAMKLYDPGMRALMNKFVDAYYLCDTVTPHATTESGALAMFPVPGVTYPRGSYITFDVVSLLGDPTGAVLAPNVQIGIEFIGHRRIPC